MPHNKRTFLTLIDVAVSAGAAVIIFAAWAKLTHQSYADMMLTIGMWTETAIFLIYAISRKFNVGKMFSWVAGLVFAFATPALASESADCSTR